MSTAVEEDEVVWVKPEYSKRSVGRAGKAYVSGDVTLLEFSAASLVIDNWRAAHGFPLNTLQILLRDRARKVDPDAIVAQRLKRMPSIELTLKKLGHFGLDRIQDIGGCRAVVNSIQDVSGLWDLFKTGRDFHELKKVDDYIWERGPRNTGYRSVHLIYAHHSQTHAEYNGLLIEVQLRSRLQHAWATAVETVAAFIGQPLKSGEGDQDWLRFFALMSSEIAFQEKTPTVPGTPTKRDELRYEIRSLAQKLDVISRLGAYQTALSVANTGLSDGTKLHYFILARDAEAGTVEVYGFTNRQVVMATERYRELEQTALTRGGKADVVLVSVADLKTVYQAYPNYFADTTAFSTLVKQATKGTQNVSRSVQRRGADAANGQGA